MQGANQPAKSKSGRLPNPGVPLILIRTMNNRTGVFALGLLSLGLGVGLICVWVQSSKQHDADLSSFNSYSNRAEVVQVALTNQLTEQAGRRTTLEKDLERLKQEYQQSYLELNSNYVSLSTNLARVTNTLSKTATELARTQQTLEADKAELAKRDTKIAELEKQNLGLDKQVLDLSTTLTNLNLQIAEAQKKLAESSADKAELGKELKRMLADKAELERQLNDLTVLRARIAKVKEQMTIARRIEWMRQGAYASTEEKGAQKLMQGISAPQTKPKPAPPSFYDLNVEVSADGTIKVIPPKTNSPPIGP